MPPLSLRSPCSSAIAARETTDPRSDHDCAHGPCVWSSNTPAEARRVPIIGWRVG
jgi:hypothetical protein